MVHVIKVHLRDAKNEKQIRRLAVSSDVVSNFRLLKEKIQSLFQLPNNNFDMKWKDCDNDLIVMSSDEELAQALANAEEGLLRVFLTLKNSEQFNPQTSKAPENSGVEHPLVTCDGCEKDLFGIRYKCLQCPNFDLCSICNAANKHSDHDMIKLVRPSSVPRKWVFCGSRKMWRCNFGFCPCNFGKPRHENEGGRSPSSPKQSKKHHDENLYGNNPFGTPLSFANLLNGDLAQAQKLLSEGFGTLMNFVPNIEVKVESKPSKAQCDPKQPSSENEKSKKGECAGTSTDAMQDEQVKGKTESPDLLLKELIPENISLSTKPKQVQPSGLFSVLNEPSSQEDMRDFFMKPKNVEEPAVETKKSDESKEKSPASDIESSACAEGWTFIPEDETSKQKAGCAAEACGENAPEVDKEKTLYPLFDEKIKENLKTQLEEVATQSNDPKIINALIKMQAMGFTNQGGWLERLLVTKHGNINEALDALYPFAQRH